MDGRAFSRYLMEQCWETQLNSLGVGGLSSPQTEELKAGAISARSPGAARTFVQGGAGRTFLAGAGSSFSDSAS